MRRLMLGVYLVAAATAVTAVAAQEASKATDARHLRVPHHIAGADTSLPSLFSALQEQLGLKLESTKAPIDVTVIDSAEHPTDD